jgi:hypothetical protein
MYIAKGLIRGITLINPTLFVGMMHSPAACLLIYLYDTAANTLYHHIVYGTR